MAPPRRERSLLLDVESLRAFREVVARDGFTTASKVLGITQPGVSLKIRRLEERVGVTLIRRDGHSLTLTDHGRELLAHAEEIVEAHDRAVDHLQRSELSGTVRLGCHAGIPTSRVHRVASRFGRTHPHIHMRIRVRDSMLISQMLADGELDVALMQVTEGAVRPTDEVWRRDELHVVQGRTVDFTDEDPVPLISYGPGSPFELHLIALLEAAGRTCRTAVEWCSVHDVHSAIEAGLGVGIISGPSVTELMRPWTGIGPISMPRAVSVVRSRPDADRNELIDALRGHLSAALASTDS